MNKKQFIEIRRQLDKTQNKMSQLLGISVKAIQSFEQGLRKIPFHIERQILFIFAMQKPQYIKKRPCWMIKKCPTEIKRNCPAWEFQVGHLCWFINGTICQGEVQQLIRMSLRLSPRTRDNGPLLLQALQIISRKTWRLGFLGSPR